MPSYQTQMKGATDWSDPEPHHDYRAAAGLELDVYLSDDVEIGTAKYGVPLQARNGRRPLIDAYQENLDCAVYLRQAIEEGVDVRAEYVLVLSLLVSLRKTIEAQP